MTLQSGTRWLTQDELTAWLALGSVLNRLPYELDAQLQRDAGLTHFEYQVLAGLSEAPGRTLRMSVLAVLANGSLPRLSQVVTRLERRGWVRRSPDPADGRSTLATLTEDGWDTVVLAAPGHVATVRALAIDPLTTAQIRQLTVISRRIMAALDPTRTWDRPGFTQTAAPAAAGSPAPRQLPAATHHRAARVPSRRVPSAATDLHGTA